MKYFDGKTYAWVGLSRQKSILGKVGISPSFPLHFTYLHNKDGMSVLLSDHGKLFMLVRTYFAIVLTCGV